MLGQTVSPLPLIIPPESRQCRLQSAYSSELSLIDGADGTEISTQIHPLTSRLAVLCANHWNTTHLDFWKTSWNK